MADGSESKAEVAFSSWFRQSKAEVAFSSWFGLESKQKLPPHGWDLILSKAEVAFGLDL